ncbi:hypothetical protein [Nocardia brasiliensis]|uniref:hypothetical protein n=1 Tax=Nocardia brasiliensis TaxID=37326 RepID=UPI003CC7FFA3
MTFSTLALVLALGLCGPLLALRGAWHLPVVLGEVVAGIMFGATGFGVLHSADPIFTFLADMGFAVVMCEHRLMTTQLDQTLGPSSRECLTSQPVMR